MLNLLSSHIVVMGCLLASCFLYLEVKAPIKIKAFDWSFVLNKVNTDDILKRCTGVGPFKDLSPDTHVM